MPIKRTYEGAFAEEIREMLISREQRGYGTRTYSIYAKLFDNYCAENHVEPGPLTAEHLQGWTEYEVKLGRRMSAEKLTFFRSFGKYLTYLGREAYIPSVSFSPRKTTQDIHLLNNEQLAKLFEAIDKYSAKGKRRGFISEKVFPTFCRLCYSCGLRPQEAQRLLRKDVNLETGEIFIRDSKTGKDRLIVMANDMLKLLRMYDEQLSEKYPASEHLFVDCNGDGLPLHRIRYWMNECWKRINPDIPKESLQSVNPYLLRHQFATQKIYEWSKKGNDYIYRMITYLRIYMGHTSIASTLYYVHLLPELTTDIPDWNTSIKQLNLGERYE